MTNEQTTGDFCGPTYPSIGRPVGGCGSRLINVNGAIICPRCDCYRSWPQQKGSTKP